MPRSGRIGWMAAAVLFVVLLGAGGAWAQSSTTNPWRATFGWEQLPEGRVMGTVSGVFPDPDGGAPLDPGPVRRQRVARAPI